MKRAAIPLTESVSLAMRYWRRSLLVVAALAAVGSLALMLASPWDNPGQAGAQPDEFFITHSAKFVCGTSLGPPDDPVVPGDYQTAVNVHNFTAEPVDFFKKAVWAQEEALPQEPPGEWEMAYLDPDYAFEIDCDEIGQWLFPPPAVPPPFYKGFVVISYPASQPFLDVVAVYTGTDVALTPGGGLGESIDIERVPGEVHEWYQPDPDPLAYYTYSAKFVCGTSLGPPDDPVVPGDYQTAINVHNPWEDPADYVELYKKAVWAQSEMLPPAPPSPWELYMIEANRAFEIDCDEIAQWLWPLAQPPAFYKGFAVIESPNELDVVAVYTAERIESGGKGFALDIEAVPYTRQPAPVAQP